MPIPIATTAEQAREEFRAAGFEPLVPLPDRVRAIALFTLRCTTCGQKRTKNLNGVRKGMQCKHYVPTTENEAAAELLRAGFEAVGPFPGNARIAWAVRCVHCRQPRKISLTRLRRKTSVHCSCQQQAREAEAQLRAAGYTPLTPYPGSRRAPWDARCDTCGQHRRPNINTILQGKHCKHSKIPGRTHAPAYPRTSGHPLPVWSDLQPATQQWLAAQVPHRLKTLMYGPRTATVPDATFTSDIAASDLRLRELLASHPPALAYFAAATFTEAADTTDPMRAAEAEYYLCDALIEYGVQHHRRPGYPVLDPSLTS